ncbi:MAG: tetratricopeptide repeat protein [Deltaproteobacteria bacterium]|nr:tetratricopeptide repeat protein [Deltaproteobacteria bacterium]
MAIKPSLRRISLTTSSLLAGFLLLGPSPSTFVAQVGTADSFSMTQAQAKKKRKKKRKKKKEKQSKKSKKAAQKPVEKVDENRTGPATLKLETRTKNFDNSVKADKKRDELIKEIKELLSNEGLGARTKNELVFRLAEAYWQKSKYIYNQEFEAFDVEYQRWSDEGSQGKEPNLESFTKESSAYKKQALSNYNWVLEHAPDYPRLDEILYIMASNEYNAGRTKEALKDYSKLIRQYKKSEYVPDAYLALGEHYFAKNKLIKATKAYKKAYKTGKKQKRPDTYVYARYKLAWCDYNAQEYSKALKKFQYVVTQAEKGNGRVRLKEEALRDMVMSYAQVGEIEKAYKYFKKHAGKEKAFNYTSKLASVYAKDGKYKENIATLRHLINLNPDNAGAPDMQSQIVESYSKLGQRDQVRKEVTRLVELYRPGSSWAKRNADVLERATTIAEQRMRNLVTEYHQFAQKFKRVGDFKLARDIYAQYLQVFPTSAEAYRLNFFYAEILWDLGEWENAAEQYDNVVKRDEKGQYTRECAYNSILAWEALHNGKKPPKFDKDGILKTGKKHGKRQSKTVKLRQLNKGGELKDDANKDNKFASKEIPRFEKKLADACDAYVRVVPEKVALKDPKLRDELIMVKFQAGYIHHKYNHFDQAATRFGELIDRWPDSKFARQGADAILDSYAGRSKWVELEKWSRTFSSEKDLMKDKKFADNVNKFKEGASFKSIEMVHKKAMKLAKKDKVAATPGLDESADRFLGYVKEFPKSQFASIALYNSQDIFDGQKKFDLALSNALRLLKEYPKELADKESVLGKNGIEEKVRLDLVRYYETIADYTTAAQKSVAFVNKYPKNKKAPDVIYNAAIFYLGLGDDAAAVKNFTRYIKDFPKQKDIPAVYMRMGGIYEAKKDWSQTITFFSNFEKVHGKKATKEQILTARYKTAFALEKAGRSDESMEACKGIIKGYKKLSAKLKKSTVGQESGGYCAFKMMEPEFAAYKAIKIESKKRGTKQLKEVRKLIDLKGKTRKEVVKKYVDLLKYGSGEWGVAGLYRASLCLLDHVESLRTMPMPKMLEDNFEAQDLFMAEIDNLAFPIEDEAINALETALNKSFELKIYSGYTLKIQDQLRVFRPASFGNVHELGFYASAGDAKGPTE